MGRHAGQTGDNRSLTAWGRAGSALLTDPRGVAGNLRGAGSGAAFLAHPTPRVPSDLPPIGTPEHAALMSGSIDLADVLAAQNRTPLVGFAPIVLDPAGPSAEDLADARLPVRQRRDSLPSRRSLRASDAPIRARPDSPTHAPRDPATGPVEALCVADMMASLAALPPATDLEDPTPTGELARPFVSENSLADWVTVDDVPPPMPVDEFQRAVRARLGSAEPSAPHHQGRRDRSGSPGPSSPAQVPGVAAAAERVATRRTRRELRARERALSSIRGVTARRLAKGGVLAFTALGVVSSATPEALGALGIDRDDAATPPASLDFAGALAPKAAEITAPALSPQALAARRQLQRERSLRREMVDEAADAASHASKMAGGAVLDLAFQQDKAVETSRRQALARAAREVARNPRAYAETLAADRGWSSTQFRCLNLLWQRESGWNYRAVNRSSGAFGIPQALPAGKMASAGPDWRTNPITQIKWGLNYIADRHGTPCRAWAHSEANGHY